MDTFSIPFSSVVFGPRTRDDKKYGNIEELAKSLQRLGTIQPIVLSRCENDCTHDEQEHGICLHCGEDRDMNSGSFGQGAKPEFILIAGGRRFRAMQHLGITELWHGASLQGETALGPGNFRLGFLFADEVPEDVRREAELEENIRRLNFDWVDEQLTISALHEAKTRLKVKWTAEQTARLLGYDSKFPVNLACKITRSLKAGDEEVRGCKDITAVVALYARRQEELALKETQRRIQETIQPKGGDSPEQRSSIQTVESVTGEENVQSVSIPLSTMFRAGDSIELMQSLPDASFSHIITDIPYGIDMDNLENVEITAAQHNVQDNIALMKKFIPEAYRLCKPHGFCCFFFDLDHLQLLQSLAIDAGWKLQRWPIIIHKTSTCRNTCAQFNTTKNYEALLYLRRDEHTVLRRAVGSSVRSYDFAAERSLYAHPFYKPSAAWSDIYDDVAFAGQTILDPFCGELSGARAAVAKGLVPSGFDLEPLHILRGLDGLREVYKKVFNGNVSFT